jgi:MYXO-CTERM domain-containing protein
MGENMFKAKLSVMLIALTMSMSATAGFVQYEFEPGSNISGSFIQDTDDMSIVFYELFIQGVNGGRFAPSGIFNNIISAENKFYGVAPTGFVTFDNLSDATFKTISLMFFDRGTPGRYSAGGYFHATPVIFDPAFAIPSSFYRLSGFVNQTAVNPLLLASLEQGFPIDGLTHIVPTRMPEPGSLALAAIAAAGIFGIRRRAKQRLAA